MVWTQAYFGTATFDNSYFDITEKRYYQMKTKMDERFDIRGETCQLTKVNFTIDSEGRITAVNETTDEIKANFQPIDEESREFMQAGVEVDGYMVMYCKRSYDLTNNGDDAKVNEGDKIKRNNFDNSEWRVETVVGRYEIEKGEVYRKLLLRRI